MSLNRYAKKRDVSEPEIVSALTRCGFSVERLDRPVDLLVGWRGRCFLVECKTGRRKLNANQRDFTDTWRGPPVVILRDAQEAIDWAVQISSGVS